MGAGRADDGATDVDLVVVAAPPAATARRCSPSSSATPAPRSPTSPASSRGARRWPGPRAGPDPLRRWASDGGPGTFRPVAPPAATCSPARPWVICPTAESTAERLGAVRRLAELPGRLPVAMSAQRARRGRRPGLAPAPGGGQPGRGPARPTWTTRSWPRRAGAARRHPDRGQRPRALGPDPDRRTPARSARHGRDCGPSSTGSVDALRRACSTRAGCRRGPRCAGWSPPGTPAGTGSRASTAPRRPRYAVVATVLPDRPGQLARLFQRHRRRPGQRRGVLAGARAGRSGGPGPGVGAAGRPRGAGGRAGRPGLDVVG